MDIFFPRKMKGPVAEAEELLGLSNFRIEKYIWLNEPLYALICFRGIHLIQKRLTCSNKPV